MVRSVIRTVLTVNLKSSSWCSFPAPVRARVRIEGRHPPVIYFCPRGRGSWGGIEVTVDEREATDAEQASVFVLRYVMV